MGCSSGYELLKKEVENKDYFYHTNEHGDIIYLSNIAGEIENSYSYDVFGNIKEQKEAISNQFKYTGEQYDSEVQQYYLRARFYNPTIGRFTQEDVYRDDGLNLYAYVINNPLLWVDPSGYTKCQRLSEEQVREIQRVADSYKVDGKKNNPYNWDAKLLQQHIDAIHEAAYNTIKKNSVLQDGTPYTRYAYGNYRGEDTLFYAQLPQTSINKEFTKNLKK